jgi:ribA/ribD-fused uncharacterized protein
MSGLYNFSANTILSQGFPCTFKVMGTTYSSAEQYMMACKAGLFGDNETYEKIIKETDYATLKALGRSVKNFDKDVWDKECERIVYEANKAKFTQNLNFYIHLLQTHGMELFFNSEDPIWGIGLPVNDPNIFNKEAWKGQNKLGQILTRLREHLISQIGY